MSDKKDSPNKEIDKALKDLLKKVTTEGESSIAPDEIRAKVAVIQAAISWEKVKHHINEDNDEFDPAKID